MTASTIKNESELFRCEAVAAGLFGRARAGVRQFGSEAKLPCQPTGPVAEKERGDIPATHRPGRPTISCPPGLKLRARS
jgi:hypothetical protein